VSQKKAIIDLVKTNFEKIIGYVINHNGTRHDGKDIFQQGIVKLIEMMLGKKTWNVNDIEGYLHVICKNLWRSQLKVAKKFTDLNPDKEQEYTKRKNDILELERNEDKKVDLLEMYLKKVGKKCRKILVESYYKGKKAGEIANKIKSKSAYSVRNQKKRCLDKLSQAVTADYEKYLLISGI